MLTAGFRGRQEPFNARQERAGRGIAQLASLAWEATRLVEELRRANELKSEFVSTISHELRTPLHHIIGYTGLLREGEFDPPTPAQTQALERVEESARRLAEQVEQILDVSRLHNDTVPVTYGDVALIDLAGELEGFARALPRSPGVQFAMRLRRAPERLWTDAATLKVARKSLLENAFKFTARGEISLTIQEATGGVEFIVADTGIGIAHEHHGLIFQPFRQLEAHMTRQYGGVGLGLYLAWRLVDMLGGTVGVDSELGRGAVCRIWLPQAAQSRGRIDTRGWLAQGRLLGRAPGRRIAGDA